jgi:hypothetical protein
MRATSADDAPTAPALAGRAIGASRFVDPRTGQPVDGTIGNGWLTVTGFGVSRGALQAAGTLAGRCAADEVTGPTFTLEITVPADIGVLEAHAECRTLRIRIEPVDVDGPRFALHTVEFVVVLTAPTGPGNLVGNLLVTIGNALRSGAPATHVADLLNHVVALARRAAPCSSGK